MPYIPDNSLRFNHETGFHGVVKIGTRPIDKESENSQASPDTSTSQSLSPNTSPYTSNLATILATSGSCSIAHDPIVSQGIWGAGWYNAAEQVAYSNNVLKMTGSIGYELIVGDVFEALLSFGFDNRAASYGHAIIILPDGTNGFMGPGWCSQVDMSASTDSNITGNISYSSAILSRVEEEIGNNFITSDNPLDDTKSKYGVGVHPGIVGGVNNGVPPAAKGEQFLGMFPFWASNVLYGKGDSAPSSPLNNVQDWSAQYNSSVEFMTLCSGYTAFNGPITPDYIMIGSMQGSGSLTFVGLSSQISPASIYNQKSYRIIVRPNSYLEESEYWGQIDLPSVIYNSVNIQTTTGSQLVTASVDVTALGDGSRPPMSFSKYNGPTVTPSEPEPESESGE